MLSDTENDLDIQQLNSEKYAKLHLYLCICKHFVYIYNYIFFFSLKLKSNGLENGVHKLQEDNSNRRV